MGVEISRKKTVMMLLKASLSYSWPPNVRVQDKRVKYVKEVKYLGMRVSQRMILGRKSRVWGVSLGELGWLQIRLEEGENLERRFASENVWRHNNTSVSREKISRFVV